MDAIWVVERLFYADGLIIDRREGVFWGMEIDREGGRERGRERGSSVLFFVVWLFNIDSG